MVQLVDNARLIKTGGGYGNERATPHKLCLCVLIKLYVSPESNDETKLNPTQVRELQLFIVQAIKRVDSIVEPVLIETCRELEKSISQGGSVAKYLKNVLNGIDSPDALFCLLESLGDVLLPPSALSTAIDVDESGRPTHIEPSCLFGVFLRRVLLACKRSFEALSRLFHEIGLYSKATTSETTVPTLTPRAKSYSLKRKMTFDDEDDDSNDDPSSQQQQQEKPRRVTKKTFFQQRQSNLRKQKSNTFRSFVSRRQLQYHLHCMVEEIESKIGILSPEQVESQVSEMLAVSPDLPRAHFVRYLNCLLHREYQGAVDSLHTYFDYCMRSGGPTSSAAIATASAAAVAASGGRGTHGSAAIHASATLGRRRPMMQYAVLNLAALHYQFGHRREAMLAIQETVRVAQQNGDHVCVVFALSWLFRLASSGGGQETTQLLRRCLNRARELGLNHVQGLSHLVTAQYRLLSPTSIPTAMPPAVQGFNAFIENVPARAVWQSLQRGVFASTSSVGSYVEAVTTALTGGGLNKHSLNNRNNPAHNQQDELYVTGMPDQASRAAMSQAIKAVNASLATPSSHLSSAMTVAGRAQLLQSLAWEVHGHSSLSWTSALTHLCYYSGKHGTAASDTCLAICRLALSQVSRGDVGHLCPPVPSSVKVQDAYIAGLLLLLEAKKTYKYHANNVMILTLIFLLLKRAIARGDIVESMLFGSTLRSLTPSQQSVNGIGGGFFGQDLHVNTQVLWVESLRTMGRISDAHTLTHVLSNHTWKINLHGMQDKLDLILSQIFLDGGSASTVASLPYTLKCLSKAEKNGQESLYHAAAIKLAATQLKIGYVNRAYNLLTKSLPHVSAHGSLELKGELFLLLAKCYIHFSKSDSFTNLIAAKDALEIAHRAYTKAARLAETEQVSYLLARVFNQLSLQCNNESEKVQFINARDQAAKHFILLRQQQIKPKIRTVGYMRSDQLLEQVACC